MSRQIHSRIRRTRASPPGRASEDDRRPTYLAALQQYEKLMRVARETPYAVRPLPLFYALSQGGRAVLAARAPDSWAARGHGLAEGNFAPPVTESTIKPVRRRAPDNLYDRVSDVIGSTRLPSAVELGALWSALPDLVETPLPDPRWPRPIRILPAMYKQPGPLVEPRSHAVLVIADETIPPRDELERLLTQYPRARSLGIATAHGAPNLLTEPTAYGLGVRVGWEARSGEEAPPSDVMAPEHRFVGEHWLTPAVAGVELAPLMMWWVLLFGLSLLARYEPAAWGGALEANASLLTVPLEDALDVALDAVPHLLLEALLGEQVLLQR